MANFSKGIRVGLSDLVRPKKTKNKKSLKTIKNLQLKQYKVEILRISSFFMVFFYRRFLPLVVCKYAFGSENATSSANLPSPPTVLAVRFVRPKKTKNK